MVNKKEDYKHLRVKKETHLRVKTIAAKLGVSIDEALNILADLYNG